MRDFIMLQEDPAEYGLTGCMYNDDDTITIESIHGQITVDEELYIEKGPAGAYYETLARGVRQ